MHVTYYVAMISDTDSNVSYEYGTQSGSTITPLGGLESGSFDTQGNIKLVIAMSKVGSPTAGSILTAVNGLTQINVGRNWLYRRGLDQQWDLYCKSAGCGVRADTAARCGRCHLHQRWHDVQP